MWTWFDGKLGGRWRTQAQRGAVAIEFAVVLPFLVFGTLFLVDYGIGVYWHTQLDAASRAGAQFAMDDKDDATAIEAAVKAAADLPPADVTVTITEFCECSFDSGSTCNPGTCGGGDPRHFLRIQASYDVDTLLAPAFTVTGETVIRVE